MENNRRKFFDIFKEIKASIISFEYKAEMRTDKNAFTRQRKMNFYDVIMFILNFNKRSLQLELDDFFEQVKMQEMSISKQAFSKSRQNISPRAFTELNDIIVKDTYKDDHFNKFKGFRLLSADGSVFSLYNTKDMREHFGCLKNKYADIAMAQASILYDVENDIIIDACLDRYETNERKMSQRHIKELTKYGLKKDLIIYDRGYPCSDLISDLSDVGINFLMRVSTRFMKEVNEFNGTDGIIEIMHKDKKRKIPIRIVRIEIETIDKDGNSSTDIETLISSLLDSKFTRDDFKGLYSKRWGIETKYDTLKNKFEIENFTGTTPITIQQDFHATIFLSNLASIVNSVVTEDIRQNNQGKNLKHDYKANNNLVIGKLKDNLIKMMIAPNTERQHKLFDKIVAQLVRYGSPVRLGRTVMRKKCAVNHKYSTNKKRCL